jgi:hydrogenase maturation protease
MSGGKILIYGYGNPGRQDDGLGIYFAEAMEKWACEKGIKNIFFDTNYQLNIEDSLLMTDKDIVLFADASNVGPGFNIKKLIGTGAISSFSTHKINPESLVCLCEQLYNKSPVSYLITIKGYEWKACQEMSEMARKNLDSALYFLQKKYLGNCTMEL